MDVVLSSAITILGSYQKHSDPVLRHTLFLDKFNILTTVFNTALKVMKPELTPELRAKADLLTSILNTEFQALSDWVAHPVYGPNHPFGEKMMQSAISSAEAQSLDPPEQRQY
jgi:hypothetical protein